MQPLSKCSQEILRCQNSVTLNSAHVTFTCSSERGTIRFDSVHATLDLSLAGTLFRQAAELGISHEAALRNLLANAARRAGLAEIPSPIPDSLASTMFMKLPPLRVRPPS